MGYHVTSPKSTTVEDQLNEFAAAVSIAIGGTDVCWVLRRVAGPASTSESAH